MGSITIVSDTNKNIAQTLDYYPYGKQRTVTPPGDYHSQRQYIGQVYDELTGLDYLNARYYRAERGQFISQDPVFWEIGQSENGKKALLNPQSQNSYSYAGDNPVTYSDPDGKWTQGQIEGANYLYNNSSVWRFAMDNPITAGVAVGVGAGAATAAASTAATIFSAQYLGGAGTACMALCNPNGQKLVEQGVSNLQQLPRIASATEKMMEKGSSVGINGVNNFLTQAQKGTAYLDNTTGNINIFSKIGDAAKYTRTTLNPEATRIISAGLNEAHNVINGIANSRFVEIISKSKSK